MQILLLIPLLLIHLFLLVNLQFTAWPEMLSYPYLIAHGFTPYRDIIFPYFPLLPWRLSVVFGMFGFSVVVLEYITWLLLVVVDLLIFILSLLLFKNKWLALCSLVFFIFWQPFLDGNMLWFDIATVPYVLLAVILCVYFSTRTSPMWFAICGILLALTVLVRQSALLYAVATGFFLWWENRTSVKRLRWLLMGFLIPCFGLVGYLWQQDLWGDFWQWGIMVPLFTMSKIPGYAQWPTAGQMVLIFTIVILALGQIGKERQKPSWITLMSLLSLAALVSAFPRFSLLRLQPVLAFLTPVVIWWGWHWYNRLGKVMLLVYAIMLAGGVFVQQNFYLLYWHQPIRFFEEETIVGASYLAKSTKSEDRVFLQGVPSQWFVLADRLPPKPWVDNFPWYLEVAGVQEAVVKSLNQDVPPVVLYHYPEQGLPFAIGTYQPALVQAYLQAHYTQTEKIAPGVWLWLKNK